MTAPHEAPTNPTDDSSPPRILVVDDEADIRAFLSIVFEHEGYVVEGAEDAESARRMIEAHGTDLLILDIDMPGMSGLDFLSEVRAGGELPVIMVSGRTDEADRVLGLDLGADDYVAKPFSPPELVARVRSLLRRTRPRLAETEAAQLAAQLAAPPPDRLEYGELAIDTTSHEVTLAGTTVDLSRKEFDLLLFLAKTPKKVFTREELLTGVWGSSPDEQNLSTVTEHVRRVRQKIEPDPDHPRWIATVRGIGYRFES